jgi:hypothetical protein
VVCSRPEQLVGATPKRQRRFDHRQWHWREHFAMPSALLDCIRRGLWWVAGAPPPAYLEAVAGRAADSRAILASSLRLKLASRIAPIRHIANTGLSYETSYSRGILPGEYTVNLHLYRNPPQTDPIPVTVVTSIKQSTSQSARQLLASKVLLVREGEEVTVYRFRLSEAGALVAGSVQSLQKPLRAWRTS